MSYGTQLDLFVASRAVEDLRRALGMVSEYMSETQDLFNQQQQFIGLMYMELKSGSEECAERLRLLEVGADA